jgi:cobalt-zinc-cadmium efflux system outer membrane protein
MVCAAATFLVESPAAGSGSALAAGQEAMKPAASPAPVLRLSLEESVALFLRQNLDLIVTRFGIDYAKGQQITARLFPNPVLTVGTLSAYTQGQTAHRSGQVYPYVQQLFEMAGKRGYRIESAEFGAQGAEVNFEDAIRQLSFTLKDTYFRVQVAQRRLALAQENRDRFTRILEVNSIRFKKGFIAEVDLIRIRLQVVDFQSQVIQAIQDSEVARADLRVLLRLPAATQLELTTDLEFHRVDPDVVTLRRVALESRPDIRLRRVSQSQRMAELKLAKAYRYPDITGMAGYGIQGPQGPDIQQQVGLGFSLPVPLFNRNQGGIAQAEVSVQVAEAELQKTMIQVENQVDVAYVNLLQTRRLVETYLGGVLDDARSTLTIVERAYERGGATIIDLLDAARTSRTIQQNYIEALFNYQRNFFLLENAVGREITS